MSKNVIKLTESDLKDMIVESVMSLIKEYKHTSGYVPHDGNGMVGGRYGSTTVNGYCYFPWDEMADILFENYLIPEGSEDEVHQCLLQHEDEFILEAEYTETEDESTNYYNSEVTPDENCLKAACEAIKKLNCPVLDERCKLFIIGQFRQFFDKEGYEYDTYTWEEPDYGE